jgi:hypothetical protein
MNGMNNATGDGHKCREMKTPYLPYHSSPTTPGLPYSWLTNGCNAANCCPSRPPA